MNRDDFWASFAPPRDISVEGFASRIDWLFNYITILDAVYFALVCAGLVGFCFFYSSKRHPTPYFTYGNKPKHFLSTMAIGLAVFLTIDLFIATRSNTDLQEVYWNFPDEKSEDVLRVQVQAQQWAWNFRYAGPDGIFNTLDDVVTLNDLRIPAGKKVVFQLTSKDVIHSFYLPNFRVKVDAMPGRISRMWIQSKEEERGRFEVACAEMCGTYHYKMAAAMTLLSPEDFADWEREAAVIALAAKDPDHPEALWGWEWE
ncbi:MAG: hypothetical protein OXB88_01170 [Bacteriovoracales bacterium]|nr:hypothetical protein [Bacteriovoracales bacterium]